MINGPKFVYQGDLLRSWKGRKCATARPCFPRSGYLDLAPKEVQKHRAPVASWCGGGMGTSALREQVEIKSPIAKLQVMVRQPKRSVDAFAFSTNSHYIPTT